MEITLVGIGLKGGQLTLEGYEAATSGKKVFLRTALSESGKWIMDKGIKAEPLDYIYERSRNFDTLSKKLAKTVLDAARHEDVVYLVDGDVSDDVSCGIILKKRRSVKVINGVSKASAYLSRLAIGGEYTAVSAYDIEGATLSLPVVVFDVDSDFIAGKVKLVLSDRFGDEIPCCFFHGGDMKKIMLYEADRQDKYDYSAAIVIDKLDFLHRQRFDFDDLYDILSVLRSENGCPWDRAQTKDSIRMNTIEEAYELVDAVKNGDEAGIMEEVGDVILQTVFQILFAEDRGSFTKRDALSAICEKLISRHTHIFGADRAEKADDALAVWEKNKKIEKGYASGAEYLKAVPSSFPALMRAEKVSKRAAKYNLDFNGAEQVFDKIYEECDKVRREMGGDSEKLKSECGDLLFLAAVLCLKLGVECEEALTISTEKFIDRFTKVESAIKADGKEMKDLTAEEIDGYYNEVKKSENR
ncbi:MAG: nucleoside triphosphate pyrophosphohydrolase [Clostridia bacterium]|nr:nucleoside triphosphate pyrophosphohydrolase [Clostridia bacterium]